MLHLKNSGNVGFRVLKSSELEAVTGGHFHEDPIPGGGGSGLPGETEGFGGMFDDLLAQWGLFLDGSDNNPSGSVDFGGGISADFDLAGTLTINATTDIGLISLDFDLTDLNVPTVTLATPDFSISGDITSQTLSGTYNVDFGGGITGSVSGSLSSGGGFSLSTGLNITF